MNPSLLDIVGPMLAALAAGSAIGLERGLRSEPAGFRTQALVCVATAALIVGALNAGEALNDVSASSRIAQGVVTGIGFVGAGVIMRQGLNVHGLTTAATVWSVAALGVVFGYGRYLDGAIATLLLLLVLTGLRWFDKRLPRARLAQFSVRFDPDRALGEGALRDLLKAEHMDADVIRHRLTDGVLELSAMVRARRQIPSEALSAKLAGLDGVLGYDIQPLQD
jgi:putative Mg2+ transporter-C (MgtC) family protein